MPSKKRTKTPRLIAFECWGECLHVALRKVCDSPQTSAAWNLIHVIMGESWDNYLDHLRVTLPTAIKETGSVAGGLRIATLRWNWYTGSHAETALRCVFKLFDENDWEGYAAYLAR